jgi:hypothetical protein
MKYDLVISLLAHEEPLVLQDLIINISKFRNNYDILIIMHLNEYLFHCIRGNNDVIVNPLYYDKRFTTEDLLKAHIENFKYVNELDIEFKYFMPIASNCMFIKKLELPDDNLYYKGSNLFTSEDILPKIVDWHWPFILENKKIVDIFKKHSIKLESGQHEGRIYTKDLFQKIYQFIIDNDIFNL